MQVLTSEGKRAGGGLWKDRPQASTWGLLCPSPRGSPCRLAYLGSFAPVEPHPRLTSTPQACYTDPTLPQSLRPIKGHWDRLPSHTGKQVSEPQQQCRFQAASHLSGVPGSFPSQERPGKAQAAYLNGPDVQPGSAHQTWDHIKIAHRAPEGQGQSKLAWQLAL